MKNFFDNESDFSLKSFDLFQFAVLNPQIAILAFLKLGQELASQQKKIEEAHQDLLNRLLELQKSFVKVICNKKDNTLEADTLENNPMMQFAQNFHETTANWMLDTIDSIKGVDRRIIHSARFFTKQYIDMMSPNNFPFLNPAVLKTTFDTKGENFRRGMHMFMKDLLS